MLFKEIVDARRQARTHAQTMDDGQWAITKAHLEHFVLRWANKMVKSWQVIHWTRQFPINDSLGSPLKQEGPKGPRSLNWEKGQGSQWSH